MARGKTKPIAQCGAWLLSTPGSKVLIRAARSGAMDREIILPGLEWQMPQGGIDPGGGKPFADAVEARKLWEKPHRRGEPYLGETGLADLRFSRPIEGPAHRLATISRPAPEMWFALRFSPGGRRRRSIR